MAAEVEFESEEVKKFLADIIRRKDEIQQRRAGVLFSAPVFRDVIEHFEEEKGPEGRWKKWSKFYKEKMEARGKGGNKVLQDTGRLRNSFKPQKYRATKDGFLWYNDAKVGKKNFPYAYAHDTGGKQLPQRQFMWLSDKAMEKIAQIALNFMLDGR